MCEQAEGTSVNRVVPRQVLLLAQLELALARPGLDHSPAVAGSVT